MEKYEHPFFSRDDYWNPKIASIEKHSMHDSLLEYLKMKINSEMKDGKIKNIEIRGVFDRNTGISKIEKRDKLFNYMRPTVEIQDNKLILNCFPGKDYVLHYANIVKTYFNLINKPVNVSVEYPSEEDCEKELVKSNLSSIPDVPVIIMGYVESLQGLSQDSYWSGSGNFLWKRCKLKNHNAILLGCKHTYWGDIAGRIVSFLARNTNANCVIYCGKLGTLDKNIVPNKTIANGNMSLMPNGKNVVWDNLFEECDSRLVKKGRHLTVPSVLQETVSLVEKYKDIVKYIDPEIGHMGLAAVENNISFSYLHIVSDNLVKHFDYDLSNERKDDVIKDRKQLTNKINELLYNLKY
ncbi:hypothetical protein [Fructilactobacillus cliffordii]|uniref:Uncharacterized protein n=1 Tax=Fructilactobacillus cliffordii TaxID=2940299 RepID=A0A9Q8ZR37_9LACO|nr:hypothetical protein [Fructilactobacillus cliffordii]USS88962.1 hypothetical protein M3M40_05605 [Fructilactobacillus cliffordii]